MELIHEKIHIANWTSVNQSNFTENKNAVLRFPLSFEDFFAAALLL